MGTLISGLDPGRTVDPAALVCTEQVEGPDPVRPAHTAWHYHVRWVQQWPLGTPYTTVGNQVGLGEQVRDLFGKPPLKGTTVAVGQAGVGGPVLDILRGLNPSCVLVGLVETAGQAWRQVTGLQYNVSKYELAAVLVGVFASGRIKVAKGLPLGEALRRQLRAYREKQAASGTLTFENDTPRDHDDIVSALSMCVWLGERSPPFRASDIGRGRGTRRRDAPPGTFLAGPRPRAW